MIEAVGNPHLCWNRCSVDTSDAIDQYMDKKDSARYVNESGQGGRTRSLMLSKEVELCQGKRVTC